MGRTKGKYVGTPGDAVHIKRYRGSKHGIDFGARIWLVVQWPLINHKYLNPPN